MITNLTKLTPLRSLTPILLTFLTYLSPALSSPALAALPPLYQSVKELSSILNNPEVLEKFGSARPIQSITRTEQGYTIVARECTLPVEMKIIPRTSQIVGPIEFEMIPGNMTCDANWSSSEVNAKQLEDSD